MANPQNLRPFVKGDPRINRKGRPKVFDALRALAQQIAHEKARGSDGQTLIIDGHAVTISEAILRQWATSKNPHLQRGFVEIAWGKVPDKVELTGAGGGPMTIEYVNDWRVNAPSGDDEPVDAE